MNEHQVSHTNPSLNDTHAEQIRSSTEKPERIELKDEVQPTSGIAC